LGLTMVVSAEDAEAAGAAGAAGAGGAAGAAEALAMVCGKGGSGLLKLSGWVMTK